MEPPQKGEAQIFEVVNVRVKRVFGLFGSSVRREREAIGDPIPVDEEVDGFMRPRKQFWVTLPGPGPNNPKGEREFDFEFRAGDTVKVSRTIKSSGLGIAKYKSHEQKTTYKGKAGATGYAQAGFTIQPNSHEEIEVDFVANVDPHVTVDVLLPDNGLGDYIEQQLRWEEDRLGTKTLLPRLQRRLIESRIRGSSSPLNLRRSIIEVSPNEFDIDAGGEQVLRISLDIPEDVEFVFALRFSTREGEAYVTDLASVSTRGNEIGAREAVVAGTGHPEVAVAGSTDVPEPA